MGKALFLIILLGTVSTHVHAQKKSARDLARERIMGLREGVLLVRLQTRFKSLQTIRERGFDEKANQIEAELKAENDKIIQAFKEEYDFSKVYFFKSQDSEELMERNFREVVFFDINRDTVELDLDRTYFLTAEFSNVQPDTASYTGDYFYSNTDKGVEKERTHQGSPDFGFGALIVMSDQFIQLPDPFPSYVRTFESLFFLRRKPAKTVGILNEKLHGFYRK